MTVPVHSIRGWLSPTDRIMRRLESDPTDEKTYREEFTAEWLQRPLLEFLHSKHRAMTLTGPMGSGKSVLSAWITDRLQRPIGRKVYQAIDYIIGKLF